MLTILPGTLPADELKRRLADTDAAVILKLGRSYPAVREALSSTGRLDDAYYVERASTPQQRVLPAADVDDAEVPYFSLAMLPGNAERRAAAGTVAVVGLGPGDADWMTPQSRRELAAATDLIGYGPYLDRVRTARRPTPAPQRQHRRAGPRPAGVHARRGGSRRRRGVVRRPRRVRDGHRRAGGGQAVAGRGACA